MREPHATGPMPPRDWSEAFAALPPETPRADALSGVFARLQASTRSQFRNSWWIGLAAALALAAVIPMAMNLTRDSGASRSPGPLAVSPQPTTAVPPRKPAPAVPLPVRTEVATDQKTLDARLRGHDKQKQNAVNPAEVLPARSTPVRIAKAERPHDKPRRSRKPQSAAEPAASAMEPLYAESARLESLLALARDDRAASATVVALGSDFEARVANIDAALTQPSLTTQRRIELWRERVSALRAYASFESTQRALAASGERYDAMLVSID